jgi:hypothetical protein
MERRRMRRKRQYESGIIMERRYLHASSPAAAQNIQNNA